eukprot:1911540-Pleurochrysis_carterae.AAC.2
MHCREQALLANPLFPADNELSRHVRKFAAAATHLHFHTLMLSVHKLPLPPLFPFPFTRTRSRSIILTPPPAPAETFTPDPIPPLASALSSAAWPHGLSPAAPLEASSRPRPGVRSSPA